METIQIPYATLRRHTEQVRKFVQKNYWWEDDTTLKTALEDDLGITGDDAVRLLVNFGEEFRINWDGTDFTCYINLEDPENTIKGSLIAFVLFPLLLLLLSFYLNQLLLALLVWPFSQEQAKWLVAFSLHKEISNRFWPQPVRSSEATFNVGDLVASVAAGRFVKRERVRFVLI